MMSMPGRNYRNSDAPRRHGARAPPIPTDAAALAPVGSRGDEAKRQATLLWSATTTRQASSPVTTKLAVKIATPDVDVETRNNSSSSSNSSRTVYDRVLSYGRQQSAIR
jgi:hypothetical protein